MLHFDRRAEPPPAIFQSPVAAREREMLRNYMLSAEEKRSQTSAPRSELPIDDPSVLAALDRLFHGKCSFCEAAESITPYRFRPTAEALPPESPSTSHLYYAWLADTWENVYALCRLCLPTEPNFFPVQGPRTALPTPDQLDRFASSGLGSWAPFPPRERPILLDPCTDRSFGRSLLPEVGGKLVAISGRGAATIEHFHLNDPVRVEQRRIRHGQYFESLISALARYGSDADLSSLFAFEKLEFGGTWYLLLRRLAQQVGGEAGVNPIVSPSRIQRAFAPMANQPDTERRLRDGIASLAEEDRAGRIGSAPLSAPRAGTAEIRRVELSNFKAIEQLALVLPERLASPSKPDSRRSAPSLLIIGENAAGKSSILEAVALALAGSAARQQLGLAARSFILDPSFLGASDQPARQRAEVTLVSTEGEAIRLVVEQESIREEARGFEPPKVFAYGAFRQYQHRRIRHSAAKYIRNLFDGSVLSNPERWLLELDDDEFRMVVRALREIFSIEGEFEVIERNCALKRCFIVTAADESKGTFARTPLSLASSGFRSVLAMTCDVMHGLMDPKSNPGFETLATARGVVLIDEVEAHLHPRWKMQIMRGLRRALPGMTFIATTHDPLCLRGMDDGEVVVLQRVAAERDRGGLPVFVEQLLELPNVSQLRVEQLLTSDFFQLYSTDTPELEARLANVADLLAKRSQGDPLLPAEMGVLRTFEIDVAEALPIGMSEAHRLVQEAVADYLKERRTASQARMRQLHGSAKERILEALRSV